MKISLTKKYRTRDGRAVRIYAVDGAVSHPVHGAVCTSFEMSGLLHELWSSTIWTLKGSRIMDGVRSFDDLVEIKPAKAKKKAKK